MGERPESIQVPRRVVFAVESSERYNTEEVERIWKDMWLLSCQSACKTNAKFYAVCAGIAVIVHAFILNKINPDLSVLIGLVLIGSGLMFAIEINRRIRLRSWIRQRVEFRASTSDERFWSGVDEHLYSPNGVFSQCERGDPKMTIVVKNT